MAWHKSAWRRRLNARTLRWAASKAAVAVAPALARATNFYGRGVAVEDAADALLFAEDRSYDVALSADEAAFIRERCAAHDLPFEPDYWAPPWRFSTEFFEVRDVEFLGHTGRVVDRARAGVITDWGAAESINRDKIRLLRRARAVEATALPIGGFNSNFHFLIDAAIPIVTYFESGAAGDAPHEIVSAPNPKRFAQETLSALARHYGASLRFIGADEKVDCARAVIHRRRRPASGWFPVTREAADRLRDILLSHFGRTIELNARRKIYLRRGPEKLRNLTNAEAVDALAARAGFESFQPAAANFEDQVALPGEAGTILAVHGAALANILFARPGTRVIEMFGANGCKSGYLTICKRLGLEHVRAIGGLGDKDQNFAADLDDLRRLLSADERRAG